MISIVPLWWWWLVFLPVATMIINGLESGWEPKSDVSQRDSKPKYRN